MPLSHYFSRLPTLYHLYHCDYWIRDVFYITFSNLSVDNKDFDEFQHCNCRTVFSFICCRMRQVILKAELIKAKVLISQTGRRRHKLSKTHSRKCSLDLSWIKRNTINSMITQRKRNAKNSDWLSYHREEKIEYDSVWFLETEKRSKENK